MDGGLMAFLQDQQGNTEGLHETTRGPWFGGYNSSVEPFMAGVDQIVGNVDVDNSVSSRDVLLDPFTGSLTLRPGSTIQNDDFVAIGGGGGSEDKGILNKKFSAKSRKLFALTSPSLADNRATRAVLYGNDDTKNGTLYLASTNAGATTNALKNYSLLEEFSDGVTYSNDAATDTGNSKYRLKVVPTFVDSGAGLYNRGATTFLQQFLTSGSRATLQTQNWLYFPNLYGNPFRWNKRFNESASVGSETVRMFPTGPWQPLFPPTLPDPATLVSSSGNSTWIDGDTFYYSVIFQFEDGSYSAPFIPRAVNAKLTSGLGYYTVGTPTASSSAHTFQYLFWNNIPIGPAGTIARILLRTPKQTRASTSDVVTISPLDLRITAVINNNRDTTYYDYNGDDNSLIEDADVVRMDYVLPRRARYIGTGDQRAISTYTMPNQSAIMLAPINKAGATDYDYNKTDDSDDIYTASAYYFRVIYSDRALGAGLFTPKVRLYHRATSGSAAAATDYETYSSATLEELVDAINATTTSSKCKKWCAQLGPGVDGSSSLFSLAPTILECGSILVTSGQNTITVANQTVADFIPIGAMFSNQNSGLTSTFPAGTYVTAKSGTTITLSNPSDSTVTRASCFYSDTGDEGYITSDAGEAYGAHVGGFVRCFSPTYPGVIYQKPFEFTSNSAYWYGSPLKPDKTSVYFTISSPGETKSGTSLAPNAWVSGNRRLPHSSPNQSLTRCAMGVADIEGAAIIAYTDGIHVLANQRGANTGEDEDVRLFTVNDSRGCISYLSLISGHGWAAYATLDGIIVTDKSRRELNISKAIYNRTTETGDLYAELLRCETSAATDSDNQYLSMALMGNKIAVSCGYNYSVGNNNYNGSKVLYYDFSRGIEANGLDELVGGEDMKAYGWSAPCIYNLQNAGYRIGAMGYVSTNNASAEFHAVDTNLGTVGDGRIENIGSGISSDNGNTYVGYAVMPPLMPSDFALIKPQVIEATHFTYAGTGTATKIEFSNTQGPSFSTSLYRKLPVDSTSKTRFHKQVIPIDSTQRVTTDVFWSRWVNASSAYGNKIWRIVLRYDEIKNPNSSIAGS